MLKEGFRRHNKCWNVLRSQIVALPSIIILYRYKKQHKKVNCVIELFYKFSINISCVYIIYVALSYTVYPQHLSYSFAILPVKAFGFSLANFYTVITGKH